MSALVRNHAKRALWQNCGGGAARSLSQVPRQVCISAKRELSSRPNGFMRASVLLAYSVLVGLSVPKGHTWGAP